MKNSLFLTFAVVLAGASQNAAAIDSTDTFTASATLLPAISVACTGDLSFGRLLYKAGNTETTVTVAAADGASAVSSDAAQVVAISGSRSVPCVIANEENDEVENTATAALSGGGVADTSGGLTGVALSKGEDTIYADIALSAHTALGNGTIYVGGTLTVPAGFAAPGTYESVPLTLTVTD